MKIIDVKHVIVPIAESHQFPGLVKIEIDRMQDENLEVDVKYGSGSKLVSALILGKEPIVYNIGVDLAYDTHNAKSESLHSEIKESFEAKQKRWDERKANEINKLNSSR
jgi:hypothetical protein